jgi:hypothetical protein
MEDQMAMQRGEISRLITLQDKGMSVASQLRQAAGQLERMQTFDAQVSNSRSVVNLTVCTVYSGSGSRAESLGAVVKT